MGRILSKELILEKGSRKYATIVLYSSDVGQIRVALNLKYNYKSDF